MTVKLLFPLKLSLALIIIGLISHVLTGSVEAQNQNRTTKRDGVWTWNWTDNGTSLELTIRGEVEFDDDYSDIKRLSSGSSVAIRERRGGVTRSLTIEETSGGTSTSYFVDGRSQPYDSEARAWLKRVLEEAVQAGLDAGPRARRILRERGPGALLDEISRLRGDHVKYLYFRELFASGNLTSQVRLESLVKARAISSDHYRAQLLKLIAADLDDSAVRSAYIETALSIQSDHYRAQTLMAVLGHRALSRGAVLAAVKAAGEISSDHYKGQVLLKAIQSAAQDNAVTSAYIESAATIASDHYRGQALTALLDKTELSKEAVLAVIKAASDISSDHYKARVLLKAAAAHSGDQSVRDALVDAAQSIGSDHYRGRVLSAIFGQKK